MLRQLKLRLTSSLQFGRAENRTPQCQCQFKEAKTALIVHGLHKSATMFLYQFFADICSRLDIPLHSIHNQPADHNAIADGTDRSFVLCPVRSFETDGYVYPALNQTRHLFQVRDPRDVLVSEYFSIGWRHTTEGWSEAELERREFIRSLSADEYVLREPEIAASSSKASLLDRYSVLLNALQNPEISNSSHFVKYETMVTEFPTWLEEVLGSLEMDPQLESNHDFVQFLAGRYEKEFLADGSQSGHKRKVTPGDHRNQLKRKTIEQISSRYSAVLETFEYR